VREAGYALLFCDTAGVAVEHRGDETDASRFKYWGTWLGGVWSEAIEGTNGIGTCVAEERPITIHRNQHFRARHTDLSCSGAPVFGVDGRLMGVLDISAIDPERSERAHALTGSLTTNSARAIEERFFRECFRQEWVVAVAPPEGGAAGMLLAVDGSQRIVGANRTARTSLMLDDYRLRTGVSLWTVFERDPAIFRRKDAADIPTQLVVADSDETWPALVTPPANGREAWQQARSDALHTRPRLDALATLRRGAPPSPARAVWRLVRCDGCGNTWKDI
jgi:transcriptional regulator of acetoin/glycerol metabolism